MEKKFVNQSASHVAIERSSVKLQTRKGFKVREGTEKRKLSSKKALFQARSGSEVKASASNVGDLGLIPGLGRSPGEGNGNPFQYSCLGNPMDRGAWRGTVPGVTKDLDTTQQLNNNTLTKHQLSAQRFAKDFSILGYFYVFSPYSESPLNSQVSITPFICGSGVGGCCEQEEGEALLDVMNFRPGLPCELFKLLLGILFSVCPCLWSYYPANSGRVRVCCVPNPTALILNGNQN